MHQLVTLGLFGIALVASAPPASAQCVARPLQHERRDAATIQRLEQAWTVAFLTGDEAFEQCLLTPDFTSILADGSVKHLADELAFARSNRGKNRPIPNVPPGQVLLHGNVAVAYGQVAAPDSSTTHHRTWYADYYVWEGGHWSVFFAQQTVATPRHRS